MPFCRIGGAGPVGAAFAGSSSDASQSSYVHLEHLDPFLTCWPTLRPSSEASSSSHFDLLALTGTAGAAFASSALSASISLKWCQISVLAAPIASSTYPSHSLWKIIVDFQPGSVWLDELCT